MAWEWPIGFFRNVIAPALGVWRHVEDEHEAEAERQRETDALELDLAVDQVQAWEWVEARARERPQDKVQVFDAQHHLLGWGLRLGPDVLGRPIIWVPPAFGGLASYAEGPSGPIEDPHFDDGGLWVHIRRDEEARGAGRRKLPSEPGWAATPVREGQVGSSDRALWETETGSKRTRTPSGGLPVDPFWRAPMVNQIVQALAILAVFIIIVIVMPAHCGRYPELPPVPGGHGFELVPSENGKCYRGFQPSDPSASVAAVLNYYKTNMPPLDWIPGAGPPLFYEVGAWSCGPAIDAGGHFDWDMWWYNVTFFHEQGWYHGERYTGEDLTVAAWVMENDGYLYLWLGGIDGP
jgi:hypothetical protein